MQGWLRTLVTNFQARQQELRQLLVEDGREPIRWVGALQPTAPLHECVSLLRSVLRVQFKDQLATANKDKFLALLRSRAEEAGAFVHFATDLGSWHTQIDADVFRGFCLADDIAPLVVLNGNDARAARSFTLLHELAHLAFGETVISNANPFGEHAKENASEQKCNAIAAEFLLPKGEVEDVWRGLATLPVDFAVQQFGKATRVSRAFSARRLADLGLITRDDWWRLYETYQAEWRRFKEKQREQDGGPTYYLTTRAKVGGKALRLVFNALEAGEVTYTRASRILGVNAHAFDGLREQLPW
jgi:Zn-dependent peptidase ImmA (M78 family)